jgi:hypothetical protein
MQRLVRMGFGTSFVCVILPLLVDLGMSVRALPDLRDGGLSNPDSYMRLVRLRDIVDSGILVDSVARDGSGHGTVLHWSHLLDSILCVLAAPFSLFMAPHDALHAASLLFGPLNMMALGFVIAWAAAPFVERKWLWIGAIMAPLSPAIISYGVVGVVHHHAGIVLVAVAAWGWAARIVVRQAKPGAGIALGAWIGLGVWLTPETVPLTMMAFGALWLAWIVLPERNDIPREIALTGIAFALATVLALLADPPGAGIGAPEIDRLSTLFAVLALAVAATGGGLWLVHGYCRRPLERAFAAIAIGLDCAMAWAWIFRDTLVKSTAPADPEEWHAFFDPINEMHPIVDLMHGMHYLLTGVLATLIVIVLAARLRSWMLGYTAVCLLALLAIGVAHVRFAAYPEAAGAIAVPVALTLASVATANWHQIGQSFARLAAILLFIQVPYFPELPALMSSARAAPTVELPSCTTSGAAPLLASHPGEVVLTDVNDTPEILYRTSAVTVGSLYHRNQEGFMRMRAAWRTAPSDTVPPEIDAAEVTLVLGCKGLYRSAMVDDILTPTLYDQMRTGVPPRWLRPIAENSRTGHVLYQVVR